VQLNQGEATCSGTSYDVATAPAWKREPWGRTPHPSHLPDEELALVVRGHPDALLDIPPPQQQVGA